MTKETLTTSLKESDNRGPSRSKTKLSKVGGVSSGITRSACWPEAAAISVSGLPDASVAKASKALKKVFSLPVPRSGHFCSVNRSWSSSTSVRMVRLVVGTPPFSWLTSQGREEMVLFTFCSWPSVTDASMTYSLKVNTTVPSLRSRWKNCRVGLTSSGFTEDTCRLSMS